MFVSWPRLGRAALWLKDIKGAEPHADSGARAVRSVTACVAALIAAFLIWAVLFEIDELTRGTGKIVPSDHVKVIQNLEGGIISAVNVREGDVVEQEQVLAVLDRTALQADLTETESQYLHSEAALARIAGELNGTAPKYPPSLQAHARIRAIELAAYQANRAELKAALGSLDRMALQRNEQAKRARAELPMRRREESLLSSEIDVLRPLVPGVIAATEMMRKERELIAVQSAISALEFQAAETTEALQQIQADREKTEASYRSRLLKELGDKQVENTALQSKLAARVDKVTRTEVRSPAKGVVKQVFARTLGQVVPPAGALMEIVPLDERLVIEAKILPEDAGFLAMGQDVRIKIGAYDFAIYGGLEGKIDKIGADTVQEKDGKEFYYVQISTQGHLYDRSNRKLDVTPGMSVSVDIVTGRKSVLTYLFKPIVRGLSRTFHER